MLEAVAGIIQRAAEVAIGVFVDQANGNFAHAQIGGCNLGPELHGKGVSRDIQFQPPQGRDAMGLEAAEGIGQAEVEEIVEDGG
jgi:hypothetical protein